MLAQRPVVVDLTVENDPDRTVFIANGLMAGGEVDNAEAAHAEADPPLREEPVVVRTAVGNEVAHASQNARIDVRVSAELKYSHNSTHAVFSPSPPDSRESGPKTRDQETRSYSPPCSPGCRPRKRRLSSGRHDSATRNS